MIHFKVSSKIVAIGLLCLLPTAVFARPSLVDMDTNLQQLVDALCHGDPALCGLPAPNVVAGQVDLDNGLATVDFSELTFGFSRPLGGGSLSYDRVVATVDTAGQTAQLVDETGSGTNFSKVEIIVPDLQGPGNTTILTLESVVIRKLGVDEGPGWTSIELEFVKAMYAWLGNQSDYDQLSQTGNGCTVPNGEQHVALNGNAPSLLGPGELEASFGLVVTTMGGGGGLVPTIESTRDLGSTSSCWLRHVSTSQNVDTDFHRLSPLSDTFATQLREESFETNTAAVFDYELSLRGATLTERIQLDLGAAVLTTRTFNPATGAQTGAHSFPVP
jgi:hypothetical protein